MYMCFFTFSWRPKVPKSFGSWKNTRQGNWYETVK